MLDNGVARDNSPHSRNAPSAGGGYIHDQLRKWYTVAIFDVPRSNEKTSHQKAGGRGKGGWQQQQMAGVRRCGGGSGGMR